MTWETSGKVPPFPHGAHPRGLVPTVLTVLHSLFTTPFSCRSVMVPSGSGPLWVAIHSSTVSTTTRFFYLRRNNRLRTVEMCGTVLKLTAAEAR